MQATELFSAAIRVIGLLSVLRGLDDLLFFLSRELNLTGESVTAKVSSADLILGIFFFLGGLYLLRGAPIILSYAFPDQEFEEKISNNTEKSEN